VRAQREAGFAMLTTLVVLFLLGIALALIGGSLAQRLKLARRDAQTVVLSALTDAALAEALSHLAINPYALGEPEHDFGAGAIESRIASLGGTTYRIEATATYAGRHRTVEAQVNRSPSEVRVQSWRRLPEGS
jgi:type II secretory pathway pseudopilin PulG